MIRLVAFLVASLAMTVCQADDRTAQLEKKLHGIWEGGPCMGTLEFTADGTFERLGYSPGNNHLTGTWKINWSALPPLLVLTCKSSDDAESFPVGKAAEVKLVQLSDETLTYEHPGEQPVRYQRITPSEHAAARLQGFVVTGTMKQVIGVFGSHGGPQVGDSFEIDLSDLPKEKMQLRHQSPQTGGSYIPFSAPMTIERVRQGKSVTGPAVTAIFLTANDANGKFLIQVNSLGLEKGSKLWIGFYKEGGFLGSMAEAEGVLK